jgi:molecular chaperone HscB
MQYYEALGLEPKLALDAEDLQKRFYERSRKWHPDRFSRAPEVERQRALDMTALLNDAFRTLRHPVPRAEYFLSERGIQLSKDVPPELLEEVFELNMALEEIRGGDESARPQLDSARERFAGMQAEIDSGLVDLFDRHDAHGDRATLDEILASLNRRRYISNLLRDVVALTNDKELNVHLSN